MLDFQKKKRFRKILYSPFVLILLSIIFIILLKGVWGVYTKSQLSLENLEREKRELEKLIVREKNLVSSIEYLKTEQGIEDEIRTKFRVVKDGEKVVVIVDNQTPTTTNTIATSSPSFWYKLFHWPK